MVYMPKLHMGKRKAMKIQERKDFAGFLEFQQDLESGKTC